MMDPLNDPGDDPILAALMTVDDDEFGSVITMVLRLEDLRHQHLEPEQIAGLMATEFPDPPGGGPWNAATVQRVLDIVDSARDETNAAAPPGPATSPPAPGFGTQDRPWRRRGLIALGLGALAVVSAGATLLVVADRSQEPEATATASPATTSPAGASPADNAPSTTVPDPADTMAIRIETPTLSDGTSAAPPRLTAATATIRSDGKLHVEGAFRSQDEAEALLAQAAGVFGTENIVESYVVDPAAPGPEVADVVLDKPVLFETGTATIDPSYIPFLEACAGVLKLNPHIVMSIAGYTDAVGDESFNLELSRARAEAIVAFYRALDIDDSQLIGTGFGEEAPVADNSTEQGREQNRRAMLQLLNVMGEGAPPARG